MTRQSCSFFPSVIRKFNTLNQAEVNQSRRHLLQSVHLYIHGSLNYCDINVLMNKILYCFLANLLLPDGAILKITMYGKEQIISNSNSINVVFYISEHFLMNSVFEMSV